ncbi:hypothetical protein C9I28_17960 [Pseudoduganella armeniaca]|uniref:Uncharacterized protein n=1 Tax=Pseudoduganella armeniaca TaxID=2072590 RepID=A0A2R4CCI3_9BURK|nr:hypothetical protein C9I28_17960 [Pseudoduganella armeniaca]
MREHWDEFLLDRLGGWSTAEYDLLARCLLYLADHHDGLWGDQLERSSDTVHRLMIAAGPSLR